MRSLIFIGLTLVFCCGCSSNPEYLLDKHGEILVYGVPVSNGAGYFINEILKDSNWIIEDIGVRDYPCLVDEWVSFIYRNPSIETCQRLWWPLKDTIPPAYFHLFLSWYRSGQIKQIAINTTEDYGDKNYFERRRILDSIFPDKKVANRRFGYFEFFGLKNVSVYCCPNHMGYYFDEVCNEKYEINIETLRLLYKVDTTYIEEDIMDLVELLE